jgi:hypothetical protein
MLFVDGAVNLTAALPPFQTGTSTTIQDKPPALPDPPSLFWPTDGSNTCTAAPTFFWSRVREAAWYQIEVDDSSDFGSPSIAQTTTNTTYTPGEDLAIDTYYWHVRASNAEQDGAWSEVWSFTVLPPLAQPSLIAPSDGSQTCDLTPSLEWSPVSGASSYRIQVDDNSDLSSPLVNATVEDTTYTSGTEWAPGTYYWRVQAVDTCGGGVWSQINRMILLPLPSTPTGLSPAEGSIIHDRTPTFTWNDVENVISYRFQIDDSDRLDTPFIDETTIITSYTPTSALLDGTYYWRVRASNVCGSGAWADTQDITLLNLPPIANDDRLEVAEDTVDSILNVLANDSDGNQDTLRIVDTTQPDHGYVEIAEAGAHLLYSPEPNYYGPDSLRYGLDDGNGGSSTASVEITVVGINDPPDTQDDSVLTDEDTPVVIDVLANDQDVDGNLDTSTVQSIGLPAHGSTYIDSTTGAITYTPTLNWNGNERFAYRVCDDGTPLPPKCETAAVDVTVKAVNDPPIADAGLDQTVETYALVTLDGSRSHDPDGDSSLTYLWIQSDGPPVQLSNGAIISPTFTAPHDPCVIAFKLFVIDSHDTISVTPDQIVITVQKPPIFHSYLSTIMRSYTVAPDLVVQSITATTDDVGLTIANQGNAPVSSEFYVDVYIDPRSAPTVVNQTWDQLGSQGLVWAVTRDALPALQPGGSLNLVIGDAYYVDELSGFSGGLAHGTAIYAQVDSFNPDTTSGNVLEGHEMIGGAYNNITGPVYSTATTAGSQGKVKSP